VWDTALDMALEPVSGLALGTVSDRGWGKVLDMVLGLALEAVLVTASDEGPYPNKLIPSLGFH